MGEGDGGMDTLVSEQKLNKGEANFALGERVWILGYEL